MTRTRALLAPTIATLIALAILISLGVWQLQRLAWKEGLIAAVTERAAAPPAPLPPPTVWPALTAETVEYRRVVLRGTFRHDMEAPVFTTLEDGKGPLKGQGWWIMTPLILADGSAVWINRGFVSNALKDPATRPQGVITDDTEVIGLMRWSEARNAFTPADTPQKNVWYTRDPLAMGAARGLERVAPFFVDAQESPPGGVPQAGETRLAFPNRHLEYALTWFGLAASLLGVYSVFVYRRWRGASAG